MAKRLYGPSPFHYLFPCPLRLNDRHSRPGRDSNAQELKTRICLRE